MKELIASGADVNTGCECHFIGALLSAVMERHVECLKEHIGEGGKINKIDFK